MQYELDRDLALTRLDERTFEGDLTDRWHTVARPNGGYVLGFALAGMRASVPHPDPLSVSTHFLRPGEVGKVRVEVDVARVGKSVSTVSARLVQDGKELVRALGTFADLTASTSPRFLNMAKPALPPYDAMPATPHPRPGNGIGARYAHKIAPGSVDWMRGEPSGVAEKNAYLVFADGRPPCTLSLPVMADSLPPGLPNVVPTAFTPTVELTVQVRARPARGPIAARFLTRSLAHGYFEEDGELWDANGELVALSRQVLKYFAP